MMTRLFHIVLMLALGAVIGSWNAIVRAGENDTAGRELTLATGPLIFSLDSTCGTQGTLALPPIKGIDELSVQSAKADAVAAEQKAVSATAPRQNPATEGVNADGQLSEGEMIELVERSLRDFTNKEGEPHVLRLMNFTPIAIPQKDAIPELTLVSPNAGARFGAAILSFKDSEQRLLLRRNLRFEWEWKRAVWVATTNQPAGPAETTIFASEIRDIFSLGSEPVLTNPLPSNLVLIRPVAKGEPLLQSNIKPAIAVTRGAAVSAEFRSGSLLVTMRAVALENGSLGQTIRVMNPTSRKEIYGKVTHENVVEVVP
jgi:flagella basal body P-ring formation protein FlgA